MEKHISCQEIPGVGTSDPLISGSTLGFGEGEVLPAHVTCAGTSLIKWDPKKQQWYQFPDVTTGKGNYTELSWASKYPPQQFLAGGKNSFYTVTQTSSGFTKIYNFQLGTNTVTETVVQLPDSSVRNLDSINTVFVRQLATTRKQDNLIITFHETVNILSLFLEPGSGKFNTSDLHLCNNPEQSLIAGSDQVAQFFVLFQEVFNVGLWNKTTDYFYTGAYVKYEHDKISNHVNHFQVSEVWKGTLPLITVLPVWI